LLPSCPGLDIVLCIDVKDENDHFVLAAKDVMNDFEVGINAGAFLFGTFPWCMFPHVLWYSDIELDSGFSIQLNTFDLGCQEQISRSWARACAST
jgi:hypothetical protein